MVNGLIAENLDNPVQGKYISIACHHSPSTTTGEVVVPPPRHPPHLWPLPPTSWVSIAWLTLAAACGGGDGGTEPTLHPTRLALVTQPSSEEPSRVNLAVQPVVELQDDQGAAVPQAGVPVTASIATGGGSVLGSTTVNTSSTGRATFTQLAVGGAAGPHTLTFTSPNLAPATSGTIALTAGAPAAIAIHAGDGQNAGTGSPVADAPSVVVTDADNNPVSGVPVTFQVTAGDGTVDPTTPVTTDAAGVAAVNSWTLGGSPGQNNLTASVSGLTPVVFGATGIVGATISGTITVSNSLLARTKSSSGSASFAIPRLPGLAKPTRPVALSIPRLHRSAPEYTSHELVVRFRAQSVGAPPLGSPALGFRTTATAAGDGIRARLVPHLNAEHLKLTGVSPAILAARVRVPQGADLERVAAILRADPAVAGVERDYILRLDAVPRRPNDPLYTLQAWHYGMIDLPEAWSITTGSTGVLVALVDDGIRFDHPAIAPNLTADGYDFVPQGDPIPICDAGGSSTSSGDGDGYDPDPTIPASYNYDPDRGCLAKMVIGAHGLHVAGTIGAVGDDALGVSGINWNVRIRPVRVLGVGGFGSGYDIAQGVLYAAGLPADNGAGGVVQAATGARIINMSLGGAGDPPPLKSAVIAASNAGALIVAAAGNSGTSTPQFPASYPEVISVSAVGPDRQLASYSNFGSTVDIAAPGGDFDDGDGSFGVMSTVWNFADGTPAYDFEQGTSMAAPHVSGVAALILASNPGLSASQLRARLLDFAVDAGPAGPDNRYGAGIVNARNSLAQNLAPTRQLRARLYDAVSGAVVQTVAAAGDGSYSFTGVTDGTYQVFAGQDDSGDQLIGLLGRRWGAFGGSSSPSSITINGTGIHHASFSIGFPSEAEPNGTPANADELPVGGYVGGTMNQTDVDIYRVLIPVAGQYTIETAPVDGACGLALEEDTILSLYDAGGALLTSNDDIDPDIFNYCARITMTLTPGTYYAGVQGLLGGTYRVQARSGS